MNTIYLKYFTEVVHSKSFNKAATKLYINRSSLIAAVNSLEKEIGYRLLNRNMQGVSLTPKGTRVYQDAIEILNKIDTWQEEENLEVKKSIHIYSLPALSETFSLEILARLITAFQNCDFTAEGITNDIRLMIQNTALDNEDYNIIIGGYYEIEKAEFDYLVELNHCIAIPLFSSPHSVYYNIELEKECGPFTELNDFIKEKIKSVTFPAAEPSIMNENTLNKQQRISVMSIQQAFNLISTVSHVVAIYPSFLQCNPKFKYNTITALNVPDIVNIHYCLIFNENIMDDPIIRKIIKNIVHYAKETYENL